MATAAFRSTTKRTAVGRGDGGPEDSRSSSTGSASGNRRRARSVSRFSHRLPSESADFVDRRTTTPAAQTRGKFVNTARGAAFEISLDDLAIELFSSGERGRSSEVTTGTAPSHRRGRSVARQAGSRLGGERKSVVGGRSSGSAVTVASTGRAASDRRRRSLSVVRYRASDSESDNSENSTRQINCKILNSGNKQQAAVNKISAPPSQQRGLRRSSSQRDFVRSNNGYSSYSSVLTDDETRDVRYVSDGFETGRPINAGKQSDLHSDREVMRKEVRHSVDDITMGLQQVRSSEDKSRINGGALKQNNMDIPTVRRSYSTKLDQSEKRKQELLTQIMLEEEHSKELERFVGEWLPSAKETCVSRRPSRSRKRSTDKRRESKLLSEEADKIIEDFISSVEDNTDISSFDGDRSDTSSTFGTTLRPKDAMMHFGESEHYRTPTRMGPLPLEMDGVVLPWLQWETNTDSPLKCTNKKQHPPTPKTVLQDTIEILPTSATFVNEHIQRFFPGQMYQETGNGSKVEQSNQSNSSRGSWSPAPAESFSVDSEVSKTTKPSEIRKSQLLANVPRRSRTNIDDYLAPKSDEEFLFERWKLGTRISSGGILICEGWRGPILL